MINDILCGLGGTVVASFSAGIIGHTFNAYRLAPLKSEAQKKMNEVKDILERHSQTIINCSLAFQLFRGCDTLDGVVIFDVCADLRRKCDAFVMAYEKCEAFYNQHKIAGCDKLFLRFSMDIDGVKIRHTHKYLETHDDVEMINLNGVQFDKSQCTSFGDQLDSMHVFNIVNSAYGVRKHFR